MYKVLFCDIDEDGVICEVSSKMWYDKVLPFRFDMIKKKMPKDYVEVYVNKIVLKTLNKKRRNNV